MRAGYQFLRLHHFQIVGNAGGETVARLGESLLRQFNRTARHLNLLVGSVQIEKGGADFVFYLATQIFQPGAVLPERGFGLQNIGMRLATLKDRNIQPARNLEGSVRISGRDSNVAIIGIYIDE